MQRLRLAVVCDYAEEGWPSMDLVGEMLCAELKARHSAALEVTRIQPAFVRRLSRAAGERAARIRFNADRALNRFFDYPRTLRGLRGGFDVFHIVDHSYAHLVHELAGERAVVTCHDLDAFRCLLASGAERRSPPLRMMARWTLAGMRKAARVCCDSVATRDALVANALVSPGRLVVIPNGVHPACSPRADEAADAAAARLLGPADPGVAEILHVGSTIPRKRIDLLLRILAAARAQCSNLRLVKAGGALTADQRRLAHALGLEESIVTMPFLEPAVLAALYRRAALVLMPSEAEGFGLPLVEAMACATPVVASDIPVLREVGAEAAVYCAVADLPAWNATVAAMLRERAGDPARWAARRAAAIRRASHFSWAAYADRCAALYREIAV
ncbi:MAG TPA: glycosyltransferase family 1 protein [Candidatus Binataceae bacterium]|nr:glycosyltransferase family 1 protein [Candidatus Binataceae bacterium]